MKNMILVPQLDLFLGGFKASFALGQSDLVNLQSKMIM